MSWDRFYEAALGVLRLRREDFLKLTPREFLLTHRGHRIREKEEWLKIKTIGYFSLVAVNGSDKIKFNELTVPTDERAKPKVYSTAKRL